MKKKLLNVLMVLCMTLLLCVPALAEGMVKEVRSKDALLAAIGNDAYAVVKLTDDITLSKTLTIGRTVTLDLNGKKLSIQNAFTSDTGGAVIRVSQSGNLTIQDGSEDAAGTIFGYLNRTYSFLSDADGYGGGVCVNGGTLLMKSGRITISDSNGYYHGGAAAYGGGVAVINSGTFTMTGGEIVDCNAGVQYLLASSTYNGGYGGGVYGDASSTIQLSGTAVIRNCGATVCGGGIYSEGNLTITGDAVVEGEIIKDDYEDTSDIQDPNTAAACVSPAEGCTAEISGGTFTGTVTNAGGTISDGTFQSAVTNDGGTISGGEFEKAVASTSGSISGGVFYEGFTLGTTVMGYTVVTPAPVPGHTHSYSESWEQDTTHHWHACTGEGCNEICDYAAHVYTDDTDATCNTCGYERTITPAPEPGHTHSYGESWEQDETYHWRACIDPDCTKKDKSIKDRSEHGYSDNEDTTCNTCGYERTITPAPEPGHTHSYGEDWSKDETHHWHVCTGCSEKSSFNAHDYGSWTVLERPTATRDGERVRSCAVCGYTQRQTLPATGVSPVRPENPVTPRPPKTEDDRKQALDSGSSGFTDVKETDWFADDVRYVSEKKLMSGTGGTEFAPDAPVTRGMVVTILARMEEIESGGSPWYAAGQKWAMASGISDGTSMEAPVTREQLAAMLFRYAVFKGMDAVTLADHLAQFSDRGQISGWAVPAANWAVGSGIMNGKSGGALEPNGTATRAELAAMLRRFLEQ